jgi:hypothetical protein
MTNSRKMITAAVAATMLIGTVSISTPASAWGRWGYGGGWSGRHLGGGGGWGRHYGWGRYYGWGGWGHRRWAAWRPGWGYGRWGYGRWGYGAGLLGGVAAASYPYGTYGSACGAYGMAYPNTYGYRGGCGTYGAAYPDTYGYGGGCGGGGGLFGMGLGPF